LRNYLSNQGVTDRDIEPLLDKLEDYSDTNDLRRLNGAEVEQYRAAGLPPPRNDWPVSAYELRLVLGWSALPRVWAQAGDVFTANRETWINPNTAPAPVLAALPGAKPEGVAKVLQLREKRLFASAAELQSVAGIRVDDEPVAFFPGRYYRLRLWQEEGLGALEYTVILTPAAPRLPWLILETRLVDRPDARDAQRAIPAFPYPPAATDRAGQ
jgi:type II secretory pathway component PulK